MGNGRTFQTGYVGRHRNRGSNDACSRHGRKREVVEKLHFAFLAFFGESVLAGDDLGVAEFSLLDMPEIHRGFYTPLDHTDFSRHFLFARLF